MKKFSMIVLFLCIFIFVSACSKKEEYKKSANIVVVIDNSYSMCETDKSEAAKFAANMIISACDDYKIPLYEKMNTNINMGVVCFGKKAEEVIALTSLYQCDEQYYKQIKQKINDIQYDDTTGTNYYDGIEMAMDMCEKQPADENMIFVMTDGQLDLGGIEEQSSISEENRIRDDFLLKYQERIHSNTNFSIFSIGIDTRDEKLGEYAFRDISQIVELNQYANGKGKEYYIDKDSTDITDYFADFLENIYQLLNPYADKFELESVQVENNQNICSFQLDKKYKTAQILIAVVDENKKNESIQVDKIKSPKSKEAVECENEFKIKGSNISISTNSGTAAGIYINNAYKGEWKVYLNKEAKIIAKVYVFHPFPIYVIPIIIMIVFIVVILIMWLFKIPPVRYKKKLIMGYIDISLLDEYENRSEICSHFSMMSVSKYFNKGNVTLASFLNDKKYKRYFFKYHISIDNIDNGFIDITDSKTHVSVCTLYENVETEINILENTKLVLVWYV